MNEHEALIARWEAAGLTVNDYEQFLADNYGPHVNVYARKHIGALLAEVARLRAVLEQARAQQPQDKRLDGDKPQYEA